MTFTHDEVTNNSTLSLKDSQINLERLLMRQGYDKAILRAAGDFKRAVDTGDITPLPQGVKIFLETLRRTTECLYEMVEAEMKKSRKSGFYVNLIEPYMALYLKDQMIVNSDKYATPIYENPIELITYFLSKELNKTIVCEHRMATEMARKVADSFFMSYNRFTPADDLELVSVLQVIRSIMKSDVLQFFEEFSDTEGVKIRLKEEFNDYFSTVESVTEAVENTSYSFKPMLVEPLPHNNLFDGDGGYLELNSPILKRPEHDILRQHIFHSEHKNGRKWFNTFNQMQSTQWKVNTFFLNWLRQCEYSGIMKYVRTDSVELQNTVRKENKRLNSRITRLNKSIKKTWKDYSMTSVSSKKRALVHKCREHQATIELLQIEVLENKSKASKARGWSETLSDAEFYSNFPCFYHPLFCDNRGRIYTYNTSLSFQGNSLAKSLVCAYHKERMSQDGLQGVLELLGGMFEGYSKKTKEVRIELVTSKLQDMWNAIEHLDYSIFDEIDADDLLCAAVLMFELYHHYSDPTYKTGVLTYIDSTSSAIQIQALCQHCEKAASLTNLTPSEGEDLPDAYKEVANDSMKVVKVISEQSDEDIDDLLYDYFSENDPERLAYL